MLFIIIYIYLHVRVHIQKLYTFFIWFIIFQSKNVEMKWLISQKNDDYTHTHIHCGGSTLTIFTYIKKHEKKNKRKKLLLLLVYVCMLYFDMFHFFFLLLLISVFFFSLLYLRNSHVVMKKGKEIRGKLPLWVRTYICVLSQGHVMKYKINAF